MSPSDLQPGDLVLVKSPGLVFRLGRTIGENPYDHVGNDFLVINEQHPELMQRVS